MQLGIYRPLLLMLVMVRAAARTTVDDRRYCSLRHRALCLGKGEHVACQFPLAGPGPACQNYTKINFTPDLQHYITNYINRRRQRIAAGHERLRGGVVIPRPQIMMFVMWDRELAMLAQRLADQCHFVHDDCRATVRYPYAGQTVGEVRWKRGAGAGGAGGAAGEARRVVRRVLDAWWGERRRADPAHLTLPFTLTRRGSVWGHFSQLAVWTLRAVGCGGARHGGSSQRLLLVCDFSHTNMLGQRTLNPGPPAPCPTHTARRSRSPYPLLCAPIVIQPIMDPPDVTEDIDYYDETRITATTRIKYISPALALKTKVLAVDKLRKELGDRNERTTSFTRGRKHSIPTRNTWQEEMYTESRLPSRDPNVQEVFKYSMNRRTSTMPSHSRHNWKNTRMRPRRPGANALVEVRSELQPKSAISLSLDNDDLEQLYQDTGFKHPWKKESDRYSHIENSMTLSDFYQ